MKLESVALYNFRLFNQLSLQLGDRITLFLGENGAGKTNILDGIAVGLGAVATILPEVAGKSFKKTDLRQTKNRKAPFTRVVLQTQEGIEWGRTEKRDNLSQTVASIPQGPGLSQLKRHLEQLVGIYEAHEFSYALPLFAYYGVSRALLEVPLRRRGFPKSYNRFHALANALEASSRFRSAFKWFYAKEQEELRLQRDKKDFDVQLPDLQAVRHAIASTFPGIENPRIETNPLRLVVDQKGETLNITQLSDGYKTMLALVMDLASRMALANPHLANPLEAEAIVMIDEVDLHLHPEWQKKVIGDLLRVFPQTQFILTSHSPYIVESINNHLQQYDFQKNDPKVTSLEEKWAPINPGAVKAYYLSKGDATSMMDEAIGLLNNQLLDTFNQLSADFEAMQ